MRTIWWTVWAVCAAQAGCDVADDAGEQRAADVGGQGAVDAAPCMAVDERCNGRDDDCDGRVDEDETGLPLARACYDGPAGTEAQGACRAGRQACAEGAFGACEGAVLPGTEACNDVDDDCDGVTDEGECGCAVGDVQPCGPGAGFGNAGICRAGRTTCGADRAWGPCEGGTGPRDETCDGADEDCDGAVDEVPGLGGACVVGDGVCARDGVLTCVAGEARPQCVAPPPPDLPETCDGVDQDCDGQVDERVAPRPCVAGVGACAREGATTCDAGRVGCDAEPGVAAREDCNGRDDDCDGRVDEGALNACGHCGATPVESCNGRDDDCDGQTDERQGVGARCTVGLGVCARDGFEACAGGRWTCAAQPHPALPEGCNGLDDDCDGVTDEGVTNACGGCGVLIETCDGADDDCDGVTDEGFGVGGACSVGTGACERDGERACRDGLAVCTAVAGQPRDEVCNAVDDDCDGPADEGLDVGGACTVGQFRCARSGRLVCRDLAAVCDAEPLPVTPEVCNDVDDDCDGAADEGIERNACGGCGAVPAEVCNDADDDCDGAIDEALPEGPCGGCGPTPREICDDVDNDCDGRVDEALLNDCGTCGAPPAEICNELDDDCDGGVDEQLPRSPCGFCVGLAERCDLLDNDCDGVIDEETDIQDAPCVVSGQRGICAEGVGDCVAGALVCHQVVEAQGEVCNGLDDDCDGRVDDLEGERVFLTGADTAVVGTLTRGPDDQVLFVFRPTGSDQLRTVRLTTEPARTTTDTLVTADSVSAPSVAAAGDGWLIAAQRAGAPPRVTLYHNRALRPTRELDTLEGASSPRLVTWSDAVVLLYRDADAAVVVQTVDAAGASVGEPLRLEGPAATLAAAPFGDDLLIAFDRSGDQPGLVQQRIRRVEGAFVAGEATLEPPAGADLTLIPLPGGALRVAGPLLAPEARLVAFDLTTAPMTLPTRWPPIWATAPGVTWLGGVPVAEPLNAPAAIPVAGDGVPGSPRGVAADRTTLVAMLVDGDDALTVYRSGTVLFAMRQPLCGAP